MADVKGKSSMKRLVSSIKEGYIDALYSHEQGRTYLGAKFIFVSASLLFGYSFILFGCYLTIAGLLTKPGLTDLMGKPLGSDFIVFYAASKLALNGDPTGIYSISKMNLIMTSVIGSNVTFYPWHYPPSFLVIVLPLSLLPYGISFAIWIFSTLYGYLWIVRRIAPHRLTTLLFLSFPPAIINFFYGQNGFLTTIFLGGGLLLLDSRPFIGGLLLGVLSYKPQLAILIPIALLAGRNWRALIGTAVSCISLALISLIVFGIATWKAFLYNISFATELLKYNKEFWGRMPTIFASARFLGAGLPVTETLHGALALVAMGLVVWFWWRRVSLPLRASILTLAIFLTTPFAFVYDLVLLALPFAWMGWEEISTGRRMGQRILAACWLATFSSLLVSQLPLSLLSVLAMFCFVIYRSLPGLSLKETVPQLRPD
jgi:alpha-1,2-mannosyltransferase